MRVNTNVQRPNVAVLVNPTMPLDEKPQIPPPWFDGFPSVGVLIVEGLLVEVDITQSYNIDVTQRWRGAKAIWRRQRRQHPPRRIPILRLRHARVVSIAAAADASATALPGPLPLSRRR
jgi:hypothetical protein